MGSDEIVVGFGDIANGDVGTDTFDIGKEDGNICDFELVKGRADLSDKLVGGIGTVKSFDAHKVGDKMFEIDTIKMTTGLSITFLDKRYNTDTSLNLDIDDKGTLDEAQNFVDHCLI